MKHLNTLVSESIESSQSRDHLIAVSKKTSSKLLSRLTNIQPTKQPVATVYGYAIKVKDKDVFIDHSLAVVETADEYLPIAYQVKDRFSIDKIVYEVLSDISASTVLDRIGATTMVIDGKLRIVTDAPPTAVIQDSKFTIGRWRSPVGARLIKLDSSMELLEDLDRSGIDSIGLVDEIIAEMVSESINSDIICKLITIAKKDNEANLINPDTTYYKGRELIIKLGEMVAGIKTGTTAVPSFVLCTAAVESMLRASGQVTGNTIDGLNLDIVCDTKTPVDYMLVGCAGKTRLDPSSLYFSPFIIPDELGDDLGADGMEMVFTRDVKSMTPSYGTMVRYALTVAEPNADGVIDVDWANHANNSKLTTLTKVIL